MIRIDYNEQTRQEIQAFVNQKAQAIGHFHPIDVKFTDYNNNRKLLFCKQEHFFFNRMIIHINISPKQTLLQNLNELKFALAHELGHVKTSPFQTLQLVKTILRWEFKYPCVFIITGVALIILQITSTPFLTAALVSAIALDLFIRISRPSIEHKLFLWFRSCEEAADRVACEICSPEERQGGMNVFARIRERHLAKRNAPNLTSEERNRRELRLTPEGDIAGDYHPSNSDRIRFIQSFA